MGIYAKECYPKFKYTMEAHFEEKIERDKWRVKYSYKNNVIRIW